MYRQFAEKAVEILWQKKLIECPVGMDLHRFLDLVANVLLEGFGVK